MQDLKSEIGSIDVIKMHYTEKVMIINIFNWHLHVCSYIRIFSNDKMHIINKYIKLT